MLATAALGANAAESQKLTMGWAVLAIIPLMVLVILLEDPHGALGQVMTWIPFTAPLTVVIRLAVDATGIAWWEVAGSIALLTTAIWLSIRIGARLFRVGFLLTGTRPPLADLWRQSR
jgi:ABC-2 type transport system permease protein